MTKRVQLGFVVAVHLLFVLVCNSQIVKAPSNQIVNSNNTAVFNCSLSCLKQLSVTWYITLPSSGRTVAISPYTQLKQIKNIFGIDVSRGTVNECPQGGYFVEQLFVRAKQQLNLMPVQCSTVCIGEDCMCSDTAQVHFSKLGVLNIVSDVSQGITENIISAPSKSSAPSTTAYGSLQNSEYVPSSCNSYVLTTTVFLPCGPTISTPLLRTT